MAGNVHSWTRVGTGVLSARASSTITAKHMDRVGHRQLRMSSYAAVATTFLRLNRIMVLRRWQHSGEEV
jgi:hypothetical protein